MGTMLGGQGVEALLASLDHLPLLYLGLNCATGPEFMTDHIRTLARLAPFPVACVPNAGNETFVDVTATSRTFAPAPSAATSSASSTIAKQPSDAGAASPLVDAWARVPLVDAGASLPLVDAGVESNQMFGNSIRIQFIQLVLSFGRRR
jgi:hypothetical protein